MEAGQWVAAEDQVDRWVEEEEVVVQEVLWVAVVLEVEDQVDPEAEGEAQEEGPIWVDPQGEVTPVDPVEVVVVGVAQDLQ